MDITENRTVLLNAALSLFFAKGYDAVSVETLRKAAGLSNGSFFHLYPSKAALAADLLVSSVADYQAALLAPLSDAPDPNEGIAAVITAMLDWVTENPKRARFMLGEARSAWFALASDPLKALNARFRDRLDAWRMPHVETGALCPMTIDIFVVTLIGPANLIGRHWAAGLRDQPPSADAAELIAAAQRALANGPAQ